MSETNEKSREIISNGHGRCGCGHRVAPADPIQLLLLSATQTTTTHPHLPKEADLRRIQIDPGRTFKATFAQSLDLSFTMASQAQLPQFDAASKVSRQTNTATSPADAAERARGVPGAGVGGPAMTFLGV